VLKAQPHQRLRWHYFLLWQMIGVETWLTTFAQTGAPRRRRSMTR
jgi:hypothetical protein